MDRTSELPTEILHNILSRLSTKTAARTSVLSKPWLKACSTNPHLSFDDSYFQNFERKFLRIVDNTLERYRHEKLPISTFKLCISFSDQTDCDGLLDKIKCCNLKNLTLSHVSVSESTLHSLLSCCIPHIMRISLHHCAGFGCIRMSNLPKLLSFSILCCYVVEVHIIDAPKLLSFEYVNQDKLGFCPSVNVRSFNISTCQNLRRVEFVKATIDDTILFQLIQKLTFIKELSLHYCMYLKIIKISSSTLEVCSIVQCNSLVQVIFDVPKLLSLAFSYQYMLPSVTFERPSSQCRVSIDYRSLWEARRFIHLRRCLVELNDQTVDLTLSNASFRNYSTFGLRSLPAPEVENLILSINQYTDTLYSSYFDAIFWTCWPKSLTVQCDQTFRKFLRQQLLKKRHWRLIKCTWKEYLINVQIDYKKTIGDDWVTLDREMLVANPRIIEEIHTSISRCIPR